jgi:hypothetical protein
MDNGSGRIILIVYLILVIQSGETAKTTLKASVAKMSGFIFITEPKGWG